LACRNSLYAFWVSRCIVGAAGDPLFKARIASVLYQLIPYHGNLRTAENTGVLEIKASIRARGLNNMFNIT